MNPYRKGATLVLRLLALGIVVVGGLNVLLEFTRQRLGKGDVSTVRCVLYGLLCLAGFVLLFLSGALAKRLTEDFDE